MTKTDVILALLDMGYSPQQIAIEVGCLPEYVRAVRQRATPEGRERARAYAMDRYWQRKEEEGLEAWRARRSAYYRTYHNEWRKRRAQQHAESG